MGGGGAAISTYDALKAAVESLKRSSAQWKDASKLADSAAALTSAAPYLETAQDELVAAAEAQQEGRAIFARTTRAAGQDSNSDRSACRCCEYSAVHAILGPSCTLRATSTTRAGVSPAAMAWSPCSFCALSSSPCPAACWGAVP